jgi:hypothetical protein
VQRQFFDSTAAKKDPSGTPSAKRSEQKQRKRKRNGKRESTKAKGKKRQSVLGRYGKQMDGEKGKDWGSWVSHKERKHRRETLVHRDSGSGSHRGPKASFCLEGFSKLKHARLLLSRLAHS